MNRTSLAPMKKIIKGTNMQFRLTDKDELFGLCRDKQNVRRVRWNWSKEDKIEITICWFLAAAFVIYMLW